MQKTLMPHPVRAALIGYGYSGKTFHAPLIGAVRGIDLIAVSSSDTTKVHADLLGMTVIADPTAAVTAADIDLVVIATPNDTHAPLARAALNAGKHVVVDKPFTLDLAEARDLVALAERNDRFLAVFHNRRWDSDFLGIHQAIDDGLIGTVSHFESHFDRFRPAVRDRWRERDVPGGGVWFDLGPHLVDQALNLFGLPDTVQANIAAQRTGAQTDDWAHVVLDYGVRRVVLHAGMLVAGGSNRFTIHGEAGSIVKASPDRQEAQLLAGMTPGADGWGDDPDPLILLDGEGGERRLPAPAGDQRAFYVGLVAALRDGTASPVPPHEALAVMAVVETAARSARERRSLPLPLTKAELAAWR